MTFTLIESGKCCKSVLTIATCPPRIAAYNGVHLVVLCGLHFAPASMRHSTCSIYPIWQALNKSKETIDEIYDIRNPHGGLGFKMGNSHKK